MSIDDPDELAALRAAGRVVAEAHPRDGPPRASRRDHRRARRGRRAGLRPPRRPLRPAAGLRLPRHRSASRVDDECVHGIPGRAPPARGPAGQARRHRRARRLLRRRLPHRAGRQASSRASSGSPPPPSPRCAAASPPRTAGNNVGAIGAAVQAEVERRGFSVCAELTGHGIGRRIHEEPDVPNIAWDGAGAHQRPRDHRRADHRGRRGRGLRGRRRLDDPHRGRLTVGALRAHDRHHRRPPRSSSRLSVASSLRPVSDSLPGRRRVGDDQLVGVRERERLVVELERPDLRVLEALDAEALGLARRGAPTCGGRPRCAARARRPARRAAASSGSWPADSRRKATVCGGDRLPLRVERRARTRRGRRGASGCGSRMPVSAAPSRWRRGRPSGGRPRTRGSRHPLQQPRTPGRTRSLAARRRARLRGRTSANRCARSSSSRRSALAIASSTESDGWMSRPCSSRT